MRAVVKKSGCDVTDAVARMVDDADCFPRFAREMAVELGWRFQSQRRESENRVRQWFTGTRRMPASALAVAIRCTQTDHVTPLLQLALLKAQMQAEQGGEELEPRKPAVRAVRRAPERLKDTA